MKNKISLLFLLFISFSLSASINIKGTIKNFDKSMSKFSIYINEGAGEKILDEIKIDANGNFNYSNAIDYVGFMTIKLDSEKKIVLVNDNTPINFVYDQETSQFISLKNSITEKFYISAVNMYKDKILPTLESINSVYAYPFNKEFSEQLKLEISRLNKITTAENFSNYPFLEYYYSIEKQAKDFSEIKDKKEITKYKSLFSNRLKNDSRFLESSGLLKQILINYYSAELSGLSSKDSVEIKLDKVTDELLKEVVCESDRGQNILQHSIDLFKSSQLNTLYLKYLEKAKKLTCKVSNDRLKQLVSVTPLEVGYVFPDYKFKTKVKGKSTLYDIKSKDKIVVFYSSTCGHCVKEMPSVISSYDKLNAKGIEFILISLDSNKNSYEKFSKNFPNWYNYTELQGWDSPIAKAYGVEGTPTILVLDQNNKIKAVGHKYDEVIKDLN